MKAAFKDRSEFDNEIRSAESSFAAKFETYDASYFAYVGVDFLLMMNHLASCELDRKVLVNDMAFLIMLVQTRGTNRDKITDKSDEAMTFEFKKLIRKYDIKAHAKALPMTQPSLPRLMSLFPEQIYAFRLKNPNLPVVGTLGDLDHSIAWPGGLAMVKDNDVKRIASFQLWYESFVKVVSPLTVYEPKNCLISLTNSKVPESRRVSGSTSVVKPPAAAPKVPPNTPAIKVPAAAVVAPVQAPAAAVQSVPVPVILKAPKPKSPVQLYQDAIDVYCKNPRDIPEDQFNFLMKFLGEQDPDIYAPLLEFLIDRKNEETISQEDVEYINKFK